MIPDPIPSWVSGSDLAPQKVELFLDFFKMSTGLEQLRATLGTSTSTRVPTEGRYWTTMGNYGTREYYNGTW